MCELIAETDLLVLLVQKGATVSFLFGCLSNFGKYADTYLCRYCEILTIISVIMQKLSHFYRV